MIEKWIERGLFASRWLMAPFYMGLATGLLILLYSFFMELAHLAMNITNITPSIAILGVLSLIDLSLAGNLLLIVIFSGYENFVSKFDLENNEDRPDWQGKVDFTGLKLKLIVSIIAISGIHLLKVFMNIDQTSTQNIQWMVIIHLVFIFSGVMLALMDMITANTNALKNK